jgi:hypothetical protein
VSSGVRWDETYGGHLAGARAQASSYNYVFSNPISLVDNSGKSPVDPPYVRLMFHGGATQTSDNNTFLNAANNVNRDYAVKANMFTNSGGGQGIVNEINSQGEGKVQSIDFFAHGGENALYFTPDSKGNSQSLYGNDAQEQEFGTGGFWGWLGYDTNESGADIGEIDYGVFTDDAKVEVHGCNVGSVTNANGGKNLASTMSKHLFDAGKNNGVVIGHGTSANPDAHKTLKGSDYRHGLRRVYHNGKPLFTTKREGRITAEVINSYLTKKREQGENYDGSNEKW